MIAICPDCETRYELNEAFLAPSGRKVRCKNCGAVWFQALEAAPVEDSDIAPQPGEPHDDERQDTGPDDTVPQDDAPGQIDIETEAARLMALSAQATQKHEWSDHMRAAAQRGWSLLAVAVVVVVATVIFARASIVSLFPASAHLYAAVNIPVNLRGLAFENVDLKRGYDNGVPVLMVRGELVNITDATIKVPRIRLALNDKTDQELYHWIVKPQHGRLQAGGRTRFISRLASPPDEARQLFARLAAMSEQSPKAMR